MARKGQQLRGLRRDTPAGVSYGVPIRSPPRRFGRGAYVTHDGITNGISVALLAAVAMWAAPGHADWRKTGMTTGDYRKDAQSDVRDLSKPRPNDPPPTTAGAGGRVTKVQGSTI